MFGKLWKAYGLLALLGGATAIDVNLDNPDSVEDASSTLAFGLMKYYTGNLTGDVPGNLPDPYFWWLAGALFGTMIDYWHITGDSTYNDVVMQGMQHQVGDDRDFMPRNQTRTEGNDDQGFWAMAAMTAAETKFADPPSDQPQWLALVQAVFNEYASRWDMALCNGGLRWQIFAFNAGFDYKNTISNGCFFNIAARLARYTGNSTYTDWAVKIWDWQSGVGQIREDWGVIDGTGVRQGDNCTELDLIQWSYNAGIMLHGAVHMYNMTEDDEWRARVENLFTAVTTTFFRDNIAFEQHCEDIQGCNNDQRSFKGYLMRWLASTTQLAPFLADRIMPFIRSTAEAAAASCVGTPAADTSPLWRGPSGTACGFIWSGPAYTGGYDGSESFGQQMSGLSAVMYTLVGRAAPPLTANSGGTSLGDPNGGTLEKNIGQLEPITTGDRVGASFLTAIVLAGVIGGCVFVVK